MMSHMAIKFIEQLQSLTTISADGKDLLGFLRLLEEFRANTLEHLLFQVATMEAYMRLLGRKAYLRQVHLFEVSRIDYTHFCC